MHVWAPAGMDPVRILIAHSFYRLPGGEDGYVRKQIELLGNSHDVAVVERRNADLERGLSTALRMVNSGLSLRDVESAISEFGPDLVHLHNAYPSLGPAVHRAAERAGVPLAMTVHNLRLRCPNGLMFTEGEICRRCERGAYVHGVIHKCFESRSQAAAYATALWTHRFLLRLERKVQIFIAPSQFMKRRLAEWRIAENRIALVPPCTDLPSEVSPPGSHGLFLGRVSQEKGVDVLLNALKVAGDPPFRIVGDGPKLDSARALAEKLGLSNTVFAGRVPREQVAGEVSDARFLVMPSLCEENAPLAAAEALAHGRPLLVSDRGGLPELAEDNRGLLSPAHDAMRLASNIRRLMNDDEMCAAMGASARRFAVRELSPELHLKRLNTVYSSVT